VFTIREYQGTCLQSLTLVSILTSLCWI